MDDNQAAIVQRIFERFRNVDDCSKVASASIKMTKRPLPIGDGHKNLLKCDFLLDESPDKMARRRYLR
jgi:hypothetical protein